MMYNKKSISGCIDPQNNQSISDVISKLMNAPIPEGLGNIKELASEYNGYCDESVWNTNAFGLSLSLMLKGYKSGNPKILELFYQMMTNQLDEKTKSTEMAFNQLVDAIKDARSEEDE